MRTAMVKIAILVAGKGHKEMRGNPVGKIDTERKADQAQAKRRQGKEHKRNPPSQLAPVPVAFEADLWVHEHCLHGRDGTSKRPISTLDAPSPFSFSAMMLGTTACIKELAKSPQIMNPKRAMSPIFV